MSRPLDTFTFVLALGMIALGAVGAYDLLTQPATAEHPAPPAETLARFTRPPLGGAERVRILLLGADRRPDDEGRSDTVLLATINARTKRVALLGIPRDLRVEIPGRAAPDKICHSFSGGSELTRKTVERLIGQPIDHTVLVLFQGFVEAVDMLGGVEVEVPDVEGNGRGMNYDEGVWMKRTYIDNNGYLHLHLKPGYQKLDGVAALGFVRYRMSTMYRTPSGHPLGDSDFKRSERQQQFLRAMAQQHLHATNLRRILEAGRKAMQYIDTDMEWGVTADLARLLREVQQDDIWTGTIPAGDKKINRVYYAVLLEGQFREMLREMESHLDGVALPRPVDVFNGTKTTGLARRAAELLGERGYEVGEVADADHHDHARTLIKYPHGARDAAQEAASILGCGELREKTGGEASDTARHIEIILGRDVPPTPASAAPVTNEAPTPGGSATR